MFTWARGPWKHGPQAVGFRLSNRVGPWGGFGRSFVVGLTFPRLHPDVFGPALTRCGAGLFLSSIQLLGPYLRLQAVRSWAYKLGPRWERGTHL